MNNHSFIGTTILYPLLNFYKNNRRAFRVIGHSLLWLVVWTFERYYFSPRLYKDNLAVINAGASIEFLQVFILFYVIGYLILPKLLYKNQYVEFSITMLSLYFLVYQVNIQVFEYLQTISDIGIGNGPIDALYVRKIGRMLREAGWAGCFTNFRVFLWNYAYSFLFVTLALVTKAIKDINGYQRKLVIVERDKFALELDFLKTQVNPHFLFNTLNSVYSRIFDTDEKAADLILRLSELMRYNLYETNLPKIELDKELAYVQNYLDLERNRLSDRYVVIDYEQSGQLEQYQIAPLLLIAFVENAFKHGIKGASEPAYVQVSAHVMAGQLTFWVENGIPDKQHVATAEKKAGGIGLGNVRRRLDALYKDKYELIITPTKNIYEVILTIQVELLSKRVIS